MEKWFSNRGQMVQVICAVLAVVIGVIVNWQQLSSAFDLVQVLRVLVYPAAVLFGIEIQKYIQKSAKAKDKDDGPWHSVKYQYLTPTIKVGSYFDTGSDELLSLDRVSVVSIEKFEKDSETLGVLVETTGSISRLSGGYRTKSLTERRFLLQAESGLKTADYSAIRLMYQKDSFFMVSICVDHINVPAQEVTFAICFMKYRTGNERIAPS